MKILAIDLGKFKSVACIFNSDTREHGFTTVASTPQAMHDLFVEHEPDRIVIEPGPQAGWMCDLAASIEIEIQVANTNKDAWRWRNVSRKTDRDDALKLAMMSASNELEFVHVPARNVRQWRSFIAYRHTLVRRRTAIKNSIRAILHMQGLSMPGGKNGWTQRSIRALAQLAQPLIDAPKDELWRGQLSIELQTLAHHQELVEQVEAKLQKLAQADDRVQLLQTIPGVGPRLGELIVAVIDDAKRFKNGKQVGAYAGLVPKLNESSTIQRQGRITKQGHRLLRALLTEVSWLMRRYNGHFRAVFDSVCRGCKTRRKIAITATARRLLVCCWAMLRDNAAWRDPQAKARGACTT